MTKALLKITVLCAACAMLPASSRAQSDQQTNQSSRSWSTKHLTATGRMNQPVCTGSKIIGAQVNDSSGHRCGQIQDIVVNPRSGQIDFALLSLNANPGMTSTENGNLVPVPWSLLRTPASAEYSATSEQPTFTLNADPNKLKGAPTISQTDIYQSQWRQRIYSYYGVTPQSSMGGAESDQGEIKGEGVRSLQQGNPEAPQPPQNQPPQPAPNQ
jgi:sporulation protein YlmC with PRC-barrel domain